jgi:hypothetical protein
MLISLLLFLLRFLYKLSHFLVRVLVVQITHVGLLFHIELFGELVFHKGRPTLKGQN